MRKTILVLAALVAMLAIPALASATDTSLQAKLKKDADFPAGAIRGRLTKAK